MRTGLPPGIWATTPHQFISEQLFHGGELTPSACSEQGVWQQPRARKQ